MDIHKHILAQGTADIAEERAVGSRGIYAAGIAGISECLLCWMPDRGGWVSRAVV
jgi:hypothetical protein